MLESYYNIFLHGGRKMYDCHVHTKFSTDAIMDIEDAIRVSGELGLGLIITDHMDYRCYTCCQRNRYLLQGLLRGEK